MRYVHAAGGDTFVSDFWMETGKGGDEKTPMEELTDYGRRD